MRRKHQLKTSFLTVAIGAVAFAQAPEKLAFEVASVKPAPPITGPSWSIGSSGGGVGTPDPTRYKCSNCTLMMLLTEAFEIRPYQLSGPGWMNTELYEISAKVPEGATKEQVRVMLQNLLMERFKLATHFDTKELQVYDLVIAKGGPKLKESVPNPQPDSGDGKPTFDQDGFVIPLMNPHPMMGRIEVGKSGKARIRAADETTEELAQRLAAAVGKPVRDMTGLTGKYDYSFMFEGGAPAPPRDGSAVDSDTGMPIEMAVQAQLGLKLESKKGPVRILVVDHAEKIPTEN